MALVRQTNNQETRVIQRYQLYVDGHRVDSAGGRILQCTNPYTGQVWAEIPDASAEDVALAGAAANRAFSNGWRA
ncbi:aldehyde dehydrogenase family protein [Cupriavidus sp. D39]|uniref:aldehyde dehydrogenase family protein n=1 Tax=Cupriavidus sp. D39 TaxID=2997877 RepID=UPI0022712D04|nr:aldehyde dehydrogenase family protein [Cupriavidus sp. D39]MCY0852947.1 aldehyde dehydrogenase family protein [Cupriavidus sp. D39]